MAIRPRSGFTGWSYQVAMGCHEMPWDVMGCHGSPGIQPVQHTVNIIVNCSCHSSIQFNHVQPFPGRSARLWEDHPLDLRGTFQLHRMFGLADCTDFTVQENRITSNYHRSSMFVQFLSVPHPWLHGAIDESNNLTCLRKWRWRPDVF